MVYMGSKRYIWYVYGNLINTLYILNILNGTKLILRKKEEYTKKVFEL